MTPIDTSAVAELVKALRLVPDQFRAVPMSQTMSTSGVIYTAFTGQFTPHPVAIEAATLIEQQSARLQELERDAARYRWLSRASESDWRYLTELTCEKTQDYIDAALADSAPKVACDAGKPL
jgi:hypothetical protein